MPINSLLPPNATELERALEAGTLRLGAIDMPVEALWNPATCPPALLPWLAWGLSVDNWEGDWTLETKRAVVASSIDIHRRKGTPASIDAILDRFDELLELVEWHEAQPRREPHTNQVILPMVLPNGTAPGGPRSRAAFAEAVIREILRVKPLREHIEFIQQIAVRGQIALVAAATVATFDRIEGIAANDPSPHWLTLLQTEDGEPLRGAESELLEVTP